MSESAASNLAILIARLRQAGIDWDGENIADLLWLSGYVDRARINQPAADDESQRPEAIRVERDESAPAPLPDLSPEFSLSMPVPEPPKSAKTQPPQRGVPFQTPTVRALRQTLELGRALRPLMKKVDSYTQTVLDETATAEQTAEQQFCMTVVRPASERWLEAVLVIEDSASSFLWRDTIRDFRRVLEQQGAFRTVNTWYLQTAGAGASGQGSGQIRLFAQRPSEDRQPAARPAKALIEASGRRLIFFVSDCVSAVWESGQLQAEYLDLWAQHGPMVVVQMLPTRLWPQTMLAEGVSVSLSARFPGATNAQLVSPVVTELETAYGRGLRLPVVTLTAAAMGSWARMLSGYGETEAAGVWFECDQEVASAEWDLVEAVEGSTEAEADAEQVEQVEQVEQAEQAEQLVRLFCQTASELAQLLAGLMALVPIDLPLVYLVQDQFLPESTPLHVAEVFLSGLVQRVRLADESETDRAIGGSFFVTTRRYDFVPGVRDLLIDTVRTPTAEAVLNEISTYIGRRTDKAIYSFVALLQRRDELAAEGETFLEFANVTSQVLRRLGGEYAALADQVKLAEPDSDDTSSRRIVFPPLEVLSFQKGDLVESGRLAEEGDDSLPLEVFQFETAKIAQQRAGLFRRLQWVVTKQRSQARRMRERLTDELALEMVMIPGGRFLMGSPEDEPERFSSESPVHKVTVPSFLMGRYPVTQTQWQFVARLPQVERELEVDPSNFKGEDRPVERVSWYEAVEFCQRLSNYTDRTYRLPTEAEWEYACRANTTTPFYFGETITTDLANYCGQDRTISGTKFSGSYDKGPKGVYREETTSVDHLEHANSFGLAGMHGNVWEWCQDHWHENYDGAPIDGSAWLTEAEDAGRVLRGGSWFNYPRNCRSASRFAFSPEVRYFSIGFRVCCSAPRT